MHSDMVNAMADLGLWVRDVLRVESLVDWLPRLASVVGAKCAGSRDGDEDPSGVAGIENDGVQAHPAGARLPFGAGAVSAQPGKLLPVLSAIGGTEQGSILHAGIYGIGIGQRRLEMPDSLELPGMLRAVVPLVGGERFAASRRGVVHELVALAFGPSIRRCRLAGRCPRLHPGFAPIIGALNDLSKPSAGLRHVNPIGVNGRSLDVVDLPARKVRAADVPFLALAIRGENECPLACTNQYSYLAHLCSSLNFVVFAMSLFCHPRRRFWREGSCGSCPAP